VQIIASISSMAGRVATKIRRIKRVDAGSNRAALRAKSAQRQRRRRVAR
jgi:hypothetical protein